MKFRIGFCSSKAYSNECKKNRQDEKKVSALNEQMKLRSLSFLSYLCPCRCHSLLWQLLAYFVLASFMTLDKRNCIIRIACCTLALVSLRCAGARFLCFTFSCIIPCCYSSTDLFAINSKRIFPWLFCLWSSVLYIRVPFILCYFVSRNR